MKMTSATLPVSLCTLFIGLFLGALAGHVSPDIQVSSERVEKEHSFTTVVWDSSRRPWLMLPNCALVTGEQIKKGTPCNDFSTENDIRIHIPSQEEIFNER